jgi:hypothetical protein
MDHRITNHKFLKTMEKRGFVKLKERSGETVLVSICWNHAELVSYTPTVSSAATNNHITASGDGHSTRASNNIETKTHMKAIEMYRPNGSVAQLFAEAGVARDAYLTERQVKSTMDEYFLAKELVDVNNPR